jgi:putative membrane protein
VHHLLFASIAALLAQMMGDDGGMGWGVVMMIVMVIGMLLFIVLAALGVVWLVRSLRGRTGGQGRGDGERPTPLEALERRFAEGEIELDDYRRRREALKRGR